MDYQATLYDPIYATLGVSALLEPDSSTSQVTLTVIDKTAGVELPQADGIQLQTIKPVAIARMVEIANNGLAVEELEQAVLTFNGKSWRVVSHLLKPSPNGESDGEVQFILSDSDET